MRRSMGALAGIALGGALALSGCGSSSPTTGRQVPNIAVNSPTIGGTLPARYTCHGQDISPPLEWGSVPTGTRSLALFAVALVPEPSTGTDKLSVGWAVAGINPALHKLPAGHLPRGAYVGLNSEGHKRYAMCPEGSEVKVQFELYGLPASAIIAPGFQGVPTFSELQAASAPVNARGMFETVYKGS